MVVNNWTFMRVFPMVAILVQTSHAQHDGGRSELPGMKQDIFDQVQKQKKMGGRKPVGKAPPDCPKSDLMSAFQSLAYAGSQIYVRVDETEGKCERLVSIGGATYANLTNFSKTCGPVGEWKRRIAENLSSLFFQGGLDWVGHENDTIQVITADDEGKETTYEAAVTEAKYENMMACWKKACDCEQANNPAGRLALVALLVIAVGGLGIDVAKCSWAKFSGKKPPKHVLCKNGHRYEEVNLQLRNFCDVCKAHGGTNWQCTAACKCDMCKKCYKAAKAKVKTEYESWVKKNPEQAKKDKKEKKAKKNKDEDDDEKSESERSGKESRDSGKETGDESGKDSGKETGDESTKDEKEKKDE